MTVLVIIISLLIITLVLLQSGNSESASSIITGGNDSLFTNRKERGGELFVTRLTAALGIAFFVVCILMSM